MCLSDKKSKWGMRALQGTLIRMKIRLPSNKYKRKLILTIIILFHNFRTELVGLNQIATVFNLEYDAYINIRNYDRIADYYERIDSSSDKEDFVTNPTSFRSEQEASRLQS
jgi:hypothetical protein